MRTLDMSGKTNGTSSSGSYPALNVGLEELRQTLGDVVELSDKRLH
jgi:hypothetical protein